jgi:hypothetical protein
MFAMNYGIPSLDLELVSGSESVPIAPSAIVYKAVYHTKFEREEEIQLNVPKEFEIGFPPINRVRNENDEIICTINIPNSFEEYNIAYKYLSISANCNDVNGNNTFSMKRTLTKDWIFNVTVDLSYMQVYAYDDNNRNISYYAGISSFFAGNSYNIPFNGIVECQIISAKNIGVDGPGVFINYGKCAPSYTNFGCFESLGKINTGAQLDNNNLRDDNNGEVVVWFHDAPTGYLSVTRTFKTEASWAWGQTCSWWCCTTAPSTGVSRQNEACMQGLVLPFGACWYFWDHPATADAKRKKSGFINITR